MTQAVASDVSAGAETNQVLQWVTFNLNNETYGVDVMMVQEVLRVTEIAPVPGAPSYVLGIINLRGKVVTVIDTHSRFGLSAAEMTDSTRIVIVELNGKIAGLRVDSVAEVVNLYASEIEIAPKVGNDESAKYIHGVANQGKHGGGLLILVDLGKFLQDDEWTDL